MHVPQAIAQRRLQRGRVHVPAPWHGVRRQGAGAAKPSDQLQQPAGLASPSPSRVKFNPTQAYESRIGSSRHPDPLDEITGYPTSSRLQYARFRPAPQSARPALHPDTGQSSPCPPPLPPSPTPSCCCWVVSLCVDSCRYIAKMGVLQPRRPPSSCSLVGLCHCVLCVDLFGLIAKIRSLTA